VNPRLLPPAAAARSVLRTQSDTRLIDLTRAGSEPAFEAIVTRYRRALVRHCANVVGDADAEEAAQDALLKAHAALLRGDPVRRLAPWLHVIAHNTALSYLRARSARPQAAEMDCDCDYFAAVDTSADSRDELHEVLAAVRSLPDRQRDAIVMRELEGRSYGEIAARLGSSHGAVRQLLNRARSSLRERVGALLPVGPLARWALAGAGGAEATGGATMSGACVLGAKACAAALIPATVALIVSAPAPRHRIRAPRAAAVVSPGLVHRVGQETPLHEAATVSYRVPPAALPASSRRTYRLTLGAPGGAHATTSSRPVKLATERSSPSPSPSPSPSTAGRSATGQGAAAAADPAPAPSGSAPPPTLDAPARVPSGQPTATAASEAARPPGSSSSAPPHAPAG